MTEHLPLITEIDGRDVSREHVLDWEARRASTVLTFLGAPGNHDDCDVDELRERLFDLKRSRGPAEILRRVAGRVRVSTVVSATLARAARGARVSSSIRIRVPSGTAEQFAAWFTAESASPDSDAMLAACPDHYVLGEDSRGRQKVVETTGGSPLPSEFVVDNLETSSLVTPASPDFPIQIAGVARTSGGPW